MNEDDERSGKPQVGGHLRGASRWVGALVISLRSRRPHVLRISRVTHVQIPSTFLPHNFVCALDGDPPHEHAPHTILTQKRHEPGGRRGGAGGMAWGWGWGWGRGWVGVGVRVSVEAGAGGWGFEGVGAVGPWGLGLGLS